MRSDIIEVMRQDEIAKKSLSLPVNRWVIVLIVVVIIIVLLGLFLTQPKPSVAAYCKVYKQQQTKLSHATGETYNVAVFPNSPSSNSGDFADAFSELEKVAPSDIKPDVTSLKKIFEKIDSDPAQGLSASLSGLSAETSVKNWTNSHCK